MPYQRAITHSRYPTAIRAFFPLLINIERPVYAQSVSGEEKPASFTVIHRHVRAAVSPVIRLGEEWRNWRLDFVLEQMTHRMMLMGYFPDIEATDRIIILSRNEVHNIVGRHVDSHSNLTRIDTRVVHPESVAGVS